jgi:hypothetical protein
MGRQDAKASRRRLVTTSCIITILALCIGGCSSQPASAEPADAVAAGDDAHASGADATVDAADDADAQPPLTTTITGDFQSWLAANGYASDDFARAGTGGSFGGRSASGEPIGKMPIVFVHGNSDAAIGRSGDLTGWDAPRRALMTRGWSDAALYGTTWGPADPNQAGNQTHDRAYLTRLRRFIVAVQQYTGAPKVSVVAHSMGTTLARKALEGGTGQDANGAYDLGAPLTGIVDTYLGVAGANLGLTGCYVQSDPPACSKIYGFWPGADASAGPATVLAAMNATKHDEGAYVFSLCSNADEMLGLGGIVWGHDTCSIPGEDANLRDDGLHHVPLKDQSGPTIARLVETHAP